MKKVTPLSLKKINKLNNYNLNQLTWKKLSKTFTKSILQNQKNSKFWKTLIKLKEEANNARIDLEKSENNKNNVKDRSSEYNSKIGMAENKIVELQGLNMGQRDKIKNLESKAAEFENL